MKKIVALLLTIALVFVLVTCVVTTSMSEPAQNPFKNRFSVYAANQKCYVYVDNITGVCYLWRSQGYGSGLTVMLDADGKPLLYQ